MSGRLDFYFRQRVTEAELDLAFELLEQADRDLATDLGIHGVVSGAIPTPHEPVPELSIDLNGPGRAYDNLGQRIFFGSGQTVDCSVDLAGVPTTVAGADRERWVSVFLRFKRSLSDARTDGNSQQVFFRRDESFEIVVRQAPDGPVGSALRPPLEADELLVCDIRRQPEQTQILSADIDVVRRQAFVFAQGTAVAVTSGLWSVLIPRANTVQDALDEVDVELRDHFLGLRRRHAAAGIDFEPHGFVASNNVQNALNELLDNLSSTAFSRSGAAKIGAEVVFGFPISLDAGTVADQLAGLLAVSNAHATTVSGAHLARAIAVDPYLFLATTNVQAQLHELVDALGSTAADAPGASQIGLGDSSSLFESTTVEDALREIADAFDDDHFRKNERSNAGMHRAIHQPVFGSGKVLLWDAQGTGIPVSRMRVYADDNAVWFMFNAAWDGTQWVTDVSHDGAAGFRVGNAVFEILRKDIGFSNFTTFSRTFQFPITDTRNTGIVGNGSISELGKCGSRTRNSTGASAQVMAGHGVTFRVLFQLLPSSITLTPQLISSGTLTPGFDNLTREGFGFFVTATVPANTDAFWWGTYIASV